MIVLGIDPGTAIAGFGLIEAQKSNLKFLEHGCLTSSPSETTAQRLLSIEKQLEAVIKKHHPQKIAVEDLFFFKNLKTVIKVSQARGVILCTAARFKIPVFEYTPLQVKQAVTGYGRAEKIQVQKMIKLILKLKEIPKPDDAADALAVAICCAHSLNL